MNPFHPRGLGVMTQAPREYAAVQGRQVKLDTIGAEPNLAAVATQLISARVNESRQWLMTLMPPTKGDSGVLPWISTFDGSHDAPGSLIAPEVFTAPVLPATSGFEPSLRVALRWGAGGTAWTTAFDYPGNGGVFGITADTVDLNVSVTGANTVFATQGLVPIVGAFMVPGQAADPSPLRWAERGQVIATTLSRYWAVKPYARRLHIRIPLSGAMVRPPNLSWLDAAGNGLVIETLTMSGISGTNTAHVDQTVNVPSQAVAVGVTNNDAASITVYLEWEIGLV